MKDTNMSDAYQGRGMKTCLGTTQPRITDFFKNQNFVLKADLPHSWTFPEDWRARICNPRTFFGGVGIVIKIVLQL